MVSGKPLKKLNDINSYETYTPPGAITAQCNHWTVKSVVTCALN